MARTTIRTEDITDSEITTAKILDGTIATADMAVDPTNASNLSSGSVPLAQLGNVDTSGIVANQDDIALLGFKVAANGSLARYNLVDQSIDAFEDASGVDASASTDEVRNAAGNYYSGQGEAPTGGTEVVHSTYTSHTFLADGDFVVGSGGGGDLDYFIVAGGAAGGGYALGGGGGAGGFLTGTGHTVTATTYPVVIGAGGIWDNSEHSNNAAKTGADSTALGYTAVGGGMGASGSGGTAGDGGSGGGAMAYSGSGGSGTAGPPRQGYDGGDGSTPTYGAGGGGGASEVGEKPPRGYGGDGGDGVQNDYRTGSNIYYGGGGGGAGHTDPGGAGGAGGGGAGRTSAPSDGEPGDPNTGGGGGGTSDSTLATDPPPNGGSGIAIFRYTTGALSSYNDMTLISNAQTAKDGAPDNADLVITYTDAAGTASVNVDIKAYVARDGSDYTDAVTLVDQGTTGGHTILTASGIDLTSETSGTSMRWKIETLNQSVSKSTRIHAVSLGWS